MSDISLRWLVTSLIAIFSGIAMALNVTFDVAVIPPHLVELAMLAFLTALATYFVVHLTHTDITIAHLVGIIGFLSLPREVLPIAFWMVFIGALAGAVAVAIRFWRHNRQPYPLAPISQTIIFTVGQAVLSFYVSAQLYLATGAPLPIEPFQGINTWNNVAAVAVYSVAYVLVFYAIFVLRLYATTQPLLGILREDGLFALVALVLPVPFAALGAEIIHRHNSTPSLTTVIIGALFTILGLNALSHSERRLRKQVEELRSIAAITQTMRGHLDLDTLLNTTYLQVANLLKTDNFVVALFNEDASQLTYPIIIRGGLRLDANYRLSNQAYLDHILTARTPLLVNNNRPHPSLPPLADGVTSWLGVPLLAGEQTLGAFVVTSRATERRYSADDLRLLTIVAASASIAIENARLYAQKSARAEQLATLSRLTALLTGTLSPEAVLDIIISSASTLADARGVAVYLSESDKTATLRLVRSAGFSEGWAQNPPAPLLLQQRAASDKWSKIPLVVKNVEQHTSAEALRKTMLQEGKSAWLELPLLLGENTLVGVLGLYYDSPQTFLPEQLDILQAFAFQAAQAIQNARTYTTTDEALERRVEQLLALAALGRLLNAAMHTTQIYERVLDYAAEATRANRAVILLQEEDKTLKVAAQRGYPEGVLSDPRLLRQGLAGEVLATRQPIRIGDVRKKTNYLPLVPSARSSLIWPIVRGDDLMGLIALESDTPEAFKEEDGHFVAQIVNQALIAIDNTRLFQTIREAYDRLQVILNAMEDAIILVDAKRKIVLANPAVALLGYTADDLLNKNVDDLADDERGAFATRLGFPNGESLRRLLRDLANPATWSNQKPHLYEARGEQGLRYIQRQLIPVRDTHGQAIGVLMVFYNKTEEQELAEARDALSQMIVHDLRSPLTAVTTSLRLLTELVPDDSPIKAVVTKTTDTSRRAIRKVLNRVDSLLDISKMESGALRLDREPAELATIADSVCVELSPLAHELGVQIHSEISENLPLLYIDADKVERMLLNLVDNALKYSPADSEVRLRARVIRPGGADLRWVQLDVLDRGPGVPDDYKQKLFDRFMQIEGRRAVRRGVGLGLTFCRMVAETHGGRIWVEDNPGGGSIFSVTLPVISA